MKGLVSLVGAGPGDPGLLTVKGLACLQEADCVVYDRLASPELLACTKPGCELIYVGKQAGNHTMVCRGWREATEALLWYLEP